MTTDLAVFAAGAGRAHRRGRAGLDLSGRAGRGSRTARSRPRSPIPGTGIIRGASGGDIEAALVDLSYLSRNAVAKPGQRVLTSGAGGRFSGRRFGGRGGGRAHGGGRGVPREGCGGCGCRRISGRWIACGSSSAMNWVHPIALVLATWLVAFGQAWLPGVRPLVHAQFDLLPALVVYAALNADSRRHSRSRCWAGWVWTHPPVRSVWGWFPWSRWGPCLCSGVGTCCCGTRPGRRQHWGGRRPSASPSARSCSCSSSLAGFVGLVERPGLLAGAAVGA